MILRRNPKMVVRSFKLSLPKAVCDRLDSLLERAASVAGGADYDVGAEVERALADSLIRMLTRAEKVLEEEMALGRAGRDDAAASS